MLREEVLKNVNEIFCDIFDDEKLVINEKTTAEDIEDWDSLENINIIVAIENTFHIKFSVHEVYSFENVGEMLDVIMEKI